MKKFLILLTLLVGCSVGLTERRIDGLSTYSILTHKYYAALNVAKFKGIEEMPEWISIKGKMERALSSLRNSILTKDNDDILFKTKVAAKEIEFVNNKRLDTIVAIYIIKERIKEDEKTAHLKSFALDLSYIKSKSIVLNDLNNLSLVVVYRNEKDIDMVWKELIEHEHEYEKIVFELMYNRRGK